MKRRETVFLKALGDIPQPYIDELTRFQQEHAPASAAKPAENRKDYAEPLNQKERFGMKHTVQQSADKNREAGINVRKLRPVTIGILASLTACAVIAAGFGTGLFGKAPDRMPGFSPEQSGAEVMTEEEETLQTDVIEVPETDETVTDPAGEEITIQEGELIYPAFSCYGDNTETGGIPEIPENGATLFTSMEDLRPLLERAVNTDLPVKGVQHTEGLFEDGGSVLVIKGTWDRKSIDHGLRSMYLTADGYLHADVAAYLDLNYDAGMPESITNYYILLGLPASVQQVSGVSVQETLFVSEGTAEANPIEAEFRQGFDYAYSLKRLANNDADYIFPETTYEFYSAEDLDSSSAWNIGSMWAMMPDAGSGLPQFLSDQTDSIVQEQLAAGGNAVIGTNSVQNGAAPFIAVYDSMTDSSSPRRLVYPEQHYAEVMSAGTRLTILCSSELSKDAQMTAPPEEIINPDSNLPYTEGHGSMLAIVNGQ